LSFDIDEGGVTTTISHTFTADAADANAAADAFVASAAFAQAAGAGYVLSNESSGTITFTNDTAGLADVSLSTVTATQAAASSVNSIDISTSGGAQTAIGALDTAIKEVGQERANLGAFQNRLSHTVSNLQSMVENTSAALSRIADADYASESANLAKNQVLQQAGTAMLSQANASTQNVLSLLK
jgi:flagellin